MFRKLVGLACALSVLLTLFIVPVKAVSMENEVLAPQGDEQGVLLADASVALSVGGSLPDVPPTDPRSTERAM